jgi:Gamma-glutamyl cyclotransferase, AIG2-like
MAEPKVWTFFYGSYMNPAVLAEAGLHPARFVVARLAGYDIRIAPRANLVASPANVVYGVMAEATHAELARLYAHARDVLGETYLPHPVLVETDDGPRPALCYISPSMAPGVAEPAYVDRILAPAREFGFPAEYVARLESFRPRV